MALSARTNRHQESSGVAHGAGAFTTASFTPANNTLLLAIIHAGGTNNDALQGSDITLANSVGLNFKPAVVSTVHPGYGYGIAAFYALVRTGAAMTLTMDAGTFDVHRYHAEVYEWTGFDRRNPIGAVGHGSDANGSGAASLLLSRAPAASSEVIAACLSACGTGAAGTVSPGSGFNEIFELAENDWQTMQNQSRTGSESQTVDWTDVGSGVGTGLGSTLIAVEVRAGDLEGFPNRWRPQMDEEDEGRFDELDVRNWFRTAGGVLCPA